MPQSSDCDPLLGHYSPTGSGPSLTWAAMSRVIAFLRAARFDRNHARAQMSNIGQCLLSVHTVAR